MSFTMKVRIGDVEIELDTRAQLHPEIIETLLKQGSKTAVEMFLSSGGNLSEMPVGDDDDDADEEED
jgi:hypothetical protein